MRLSFLRLSVPQPLRAVFRRVSVFSASHPYLAGVPAAFLTGLALSTAFHTVVDPQGGPLGEFPRGCLYGGIGALFMATCIWRSRRGERRDEPPRAKQDKPAGPE